MSPSRVAGVPVFERNRSAALGERVLQSADAKLGLLQPVCEWSLPAGDAEFTFVPIGEFQLFEPGAIQRGDCGAAVALAERGATELLGRGG